MSTYDDWMTRMGWRTAAPTPMLDLATGLGLFGTGLAVGAGLGLILAPKTGRQLRDDLSRSAGQLGDRLKRQARALTTEAATHVGYDPNSSHG